ncbi:MAG: signal peptidase I [Agitococcus sp.]|nr:signal peptidase I [Agitococcus sp.]
MSISSTMAYVSQPLRYLFRGIGSRLVALKSYCQANKAKAYGAMVLYLAILIAAGMAMNSIFERYAIGVDVGEKYHSNNRTLFFITMEHGLTMTDIHKGDFIMFHTNKLMPYHSTDDNIIKRVLALPGDRVDIKNDRLYVNGQFIDKLYLLPRLKKKPQSFDTSYILPENRIFVFGAHPRSYDSRYWGLINIYNVLGHAKPLFD